MSKEFTDLDRLGCWEVVEVPRDFPGNITTSKWILKKKYTSVGKFERMKHGSSWGYKSKAWC